MSKDNKKDHKHKEAAKEQAKAAAAGKSAPAPAHDAAAPAKAKQEKKQKAKKADAAAPTVAASTGAPAAEKQQKKQKSEAKTKAAAGATGASTARPAGSKKSSKKEKSAVAAAPAAVVDMKAPHMKKIVKALGEIPTEIEQLVARTLFELEVSSKDLTAELQDLYFVSAKSVDIPGAKTSAIVVFVPYRQHSKYKKVHARLVRELEKKLTRHVCIIAQRTILSKNYTRANKGQLRPRSRTLTAVHNAILDDLVYPTLIVGKRLRVKTDGSRILKIHLDPKDTKEMEGKTKTFQTIYKRLTNKTVEFIFPLVDD